MNDAIQQSNDFCHTLSIWITKFINYNRNNILLLTLIRWHHLRVYILLYCPVLWTILLKIRGLHTINYTLLLGLWIATMQYTYNILKVILYNVQYCSQKEKFLQLKINISHIKKKINENASLHNISQITIKQLTLHVLVPVLAADILFLTMFPLKTRIITLSAIFFTICIHTIMRYSTYLKWISIILITNVGIFACWYVLCDTLELIPVMLYVSCTLWTFGYSVIFSYTSYAHKESKLYGKMTECSYLRFGYHCKSSSRYLTSTVKNKISAINIAKHLQNTNMRIEKLIWSAYKLVLILIWLTGYNLHLNPLFTITFPFAMYLLYTQIYDINIDDIVDCNRRFEKNVHFATAISLAILLGIM